MSNHNLLGRDTIAINLIEHSTNVTKALTRLLKYGTNYSNKILESPVEETVRTILEFKEVSDMLINQLPRPPVSYMSRTLIEWFESSSTQEKEEFITTSFENLSVFMQSIGLNIINHFNLWSYPWNTQIVNGVDISPYHPENLAMQVIENVWRTVKDDA